MMKSNQQSFSTQKIIDNLRKENASLREEIERLKGENIKIRAAINDVKSIISISEKSLQLK